MDTSEHDKKITEAKQKRDALMPSMDTAAQKAIEALAGSVAEWIENTARDRAQTDQERTLKLNSENKFKEFRAEVKSLVEGMPQAAKAELGKPNYWAHKRADGEAGPYTIDHLGELGSGTVLSIGVYQLAAGLEPILKKYGYRKDDDDRYPRRKPSNLSKDAGDAVREYAKLASDYHIAEVYVRTAESQKNRDIIGDLWDSNG